MEIRDKQVLGAALHNFCVALTRQGEGAVHALALDLTKAEVRIVADVHLDGWPMTLEVASFVKNIDQLIQVDGLQLGAHAQGAFDVLAQCSRQQMQRYRQYTAAMSFI